MSDEELLALLRQYELAAMGSSVSAGATVATTVFPNTSTLPTLEVDRYNALNAYLARPLGNEIPNRSQVVMPVLRDTVEWMMPQLMRMFDGSKYICRFEAETEGDEQQAELETAVVNAVFMRENDGFRILHDFFHDALLLRNGYVEVDTVEESFVREEKYSGLSEIELAAILQDNGDEKIEVLEHREYTDDIPLPLPQSGLSNVPQVAIPQLILKRSCFDIRIRRSGKKKRCKVTCLPPEEMRVSARAREGMEGVVYACHVTVSTRSDLISQGYDRDWVNSCQAGNPDWMEMDALARSTNTDQLSTDNPSDRAMQEVQLRRVIVRVDGDGDGVAELRRIIVGGDKIGDNDVIEETPFVSCVGMRMPHRHTGMSLYDRVMDLQVLQTELWRGAVDNFRISQNVRVAVDWRNCNYDDLLTSRPGAPTRGNGPPSGWIQPLEMPSNLTEQALPALAYIDQMRSNRTGIGKGTMGLDADELQNVTKGGQLASMSAATLILEHIARHLAEGVKDIFLKIRSELMRHQDKPMEFQLSGKWVQVNPSEWHARSKIAINVGLGSGNSEEKRANAMLLAQMMQGLAPFNMVGPKQAYEAFRYGLEAMGINSPERYAMEPDSPEFKQHLQQMQQMQQMAPPAPQVQAAKIRAETELAKQQAENAREQGQLQSQVLEGRLQLVHEAIQQKDQQLHESVQGHKDREVQLDANHLQIILKLIPALAQILAAQKRDASELGADVK